MLSNKTPQALEFEVMPRTDEGAGGGSPEPPKILARRLKIGISVAAILALGGAAYFAYQKFFAKDQVRAPSYPPAANIEIEAPPKKPVDSDEDGLLDDRESELGTRVDNPDTDIDGLADGDEVNVYDSSPLLFDSDKDGFEDGREVARQYSPTIDSIEKASAAELQQWAQRIAEHGLHEPTKTTLVLQKDIANQAVSKTKYTNPKLGFSLELPSLLTYRESEDNRTVGIYVTGNKPAENDLTTDPINITMAVKVEGQTLPKWIDDHFVYKKLEIVEAHELKPIRVIGLADEDCPQNKTFFEKGSTVIVLTLTCNKSPDFLTLYEQVVLSFKLENAKI